MNWATHPSPRSRDPIPHVVRREVLARDGARCQLRYSGCLVRATEVDHRDRAYAGPDRHAAHRCQSVCTWCHRVKTQHEARDAQDRARRRPAPRHPSMGRWSE